MTMITMNIWRTHQHNSSKLPGSPPSQPNRFLFVCCCFLLSLCELQVVLLMLCASLLACWTAWAHAIWDIFVCQEISPFLQSAFAYDFFACLPCLAISDAHSHILLWSFCLPRRLFFRFFQGLFRLVLILQTLLTGGGGGIIRYPLFSTRLHPIYLTLPALLVSRLFTFYSLASGIGSFSFFSYSDALCYCFLFALLFMLLCL